MNLICWLIGHDLNRIGLEHGCETCERCLAEGRMYGHGDSIDNGYGVFWSAHHWISLMWWRHVTRRFSPSYRIRQWWEIHVRGGDGLPF